MQDYEDSDEIVQKVDATTMENKLQKSLENTKQAPQQISCTIVGPGVENPAADEQTEFTGMFKAILCSRLFGL